MGQVTEVRPAAPTEEAELHPGQRVAARVLEVLESGDVVLELGQSRAVAAVPPGGPLQVGDRVTLEVVTGGVTPQLRIVTDTTATSPPAAAGPRLGPGVDSLPDPLSPHDLPVILQALANFVPGAVPMADALSELLRAAAVFDVRPEVMDQLQRLFGPLNAGVPPETLAAMIRTFLAHSGPFTENHLCAALTNSPLASTPDQHQAVSDLRVLLGQLAAAGAPVSDAVRSLGEALLQQQLVVAERLAGAGVGHISIPFMFGQQRADVVVEWKRDARRSKRDRPNQPITIGVFVHLPALGAIETRVDWKPDSLTVAFYVERDATRALVEAGLASFSEQLSRSGCPPVTSSVWLNPGRMANVAEPVNARVPGGTILDVMA